jgi:peptidoglycan L-alanyl-D-glutamate endopeptidase CwlK
MPFSLGQRSLAELQGVHPDLVRVIKRAITITAQDFMVVQGTRTKEEMWANYGKGRTRQECALKGVPVKYSMPGEAKVTWLNNPLMSNHRIMPDGFGHGVDLGTFPYGGNTKQYRLIWEAMKKAMAIEGVKLRSGIDWDGDNIPMEKGESDLGHYELVA